MPSKSLFPKSCRCSVINPSGLQSQIPWGFSVPLPDPQVGKSVVGPRTFLTVQEFIWYNCSAVCGSSAQQIYSGVKGELLQESLCHTLCDPRLLHPEPLSLQPATADCRDSSEGTKTLKDRYVSVSVGSLAPGMHKALFEPSECLWGVWGLILNVISPLLQSCWGLSFALGHGVIFCSGSQHLPLNGCLAVSCNFGVLVGDEHTSFYSALLGSK